MATKERYSLMLQAGLDRRVKLRQRRLVDLTVGELLDSLNQLKELEKTLQVLKEKVQ